MRVEGRGEADSLLRHGTSLKAGELDYRDRSHCHVVAGADVILREERLIPHRDCELIIAVVPGKTAVLYLRQYALEICNRPSHPHASPLFKRPSVRAIGAEIGDRRLHQSFNVAIVGRNGHDSMIYPQDHAYFI